MTSATSDAQDPMRAISAELGQMVGFLRAHVANQERINRDNKEIAAQLTQAVTLLREKTAQIEERTRDVKSHGERLAAVEVDAKCVPDLYDRVNRVSNRQNWFLGAMGAIVALGSMFGPSVGRWVIGVIGG